MIQFKVLRGLSELESVKEEWDQVAAGFPFYRHEWMLNWMLELGTKLEPRVGVVMDASGRWIGFAPFVRHQTAMGGQTLELISSGPACADYIGLAVVPGFENEVISTISNWLVESHNKTEDRFDTLILEGVLSDCHVVKSLCTNLTEHGFQIHREPIESGWAVALPDSWKKFESSLKKSTRRKTRKATKRLAEPTTNVRTASNDPQGIDSVWDPFVELHQLRRHSLGQSGCFDDPKFHMFLKMATRQLTEAGRAEVAVLESHGQPFASMLLLNDDQTVYMYQSGIHPDHLHQEPGYQMITWAIKHSIESGFRQFDFLRGDEPYKAKWNSTRKSMDRIRISAPHISARIRHQVWLSGKALKSCFFSEGTGVVDS